MYELRHKAGFIEPCLLLIVSAIIKSVSALFAYTGLETFFAFLQEGFRCFVGVAALPHLERADQCAHWSDCSNAADSFCWWCMLERPLRLLWVLGNVHASVHGGAGQGSVTLALPIACKALHILFLSAYLKDPAPHQFVKGLKKTRPAAEFIHSHPWGTSRKESDRGRPARGGAHTFTPFRQHQGKPNGGGVLDS